MAAIRNRTHNAYWNDRVGFFGFFACEENADTAKALLAQVEKTLFKLNCDTIRGPYNPSINEECGLLTMGHNEPPSISMPWNPAYYAGLLESASQQVYATFSVSICRSISAFRPASRRSPGGFVSGRRM